MATNSIQKQQSMRYRSALASVKDERVNIDPTQHLYLKYIAKLTARSVDALMHEIVEDWLDVSYPCYAQAIEEKHNLPSTTAGETDPKASHKAFDNMLKNLESITSAN